MRELENIKDIELYELYVNVINEFKKRKIIRTRNVVGDLGEYLAIEYYNKTPGLPKLQFAPAGTKNIDAISRDGDRYSIKTTTTGLTSVFYGLPPLNSNEKCEKKFEYVIVVEMDKELRLKKILQLDWEQFYSCKRWHSRMAAWNLSVNSDMLSKAKVIFSNI